MQKHNYFIYLIFILFISLFSSSCQDTQEETEDEIEFSCFANRINYYSESGELTRYSKRAYTQDKKLLYDSTFKASDNSLQTVNKYTYTGNNNVEQSFTVRNGQLVLGFELFSEQNKLVKIINYDTNGNLLGKTIFIFTGDLATRSEYYDNNNVLKQYRTTEYNGQLKTKTSSFDENNNLLNSTKYEYQQNDLVKEELYNANGQLTKYYVTTRQNNTTTRQAYDEQGNSLTEKTIYKKDSNNYTIYAFSQFSANSYEEINYTITYNEHNYPTTFITQSKRFTSGSVSSESYTKRVHSDIQCY